MCDLCQRSAAHKDHKWDAVSDLAAAEKARVAAVHQRCSQLSQQLHERGIALSNAGKSHAQSAHAAREEIRRVAAQLKSAIDARASVLEQEVDQANKVSLVHVSSDIGASLYILTGSS